MLSLRVTLIIISVPLEYLIALLFNSFIIRSIDIIRFESIFNSSSKFIDEKYAKLLELNVGDPGLVAYNQCFSSSGTVFNYSKIVYHYKNTQFYDQSSTTK